MAIKAVVYHRTDPGKVNTKGKQMVEFLCDLAEARGYEVADTFCESNRVSIPESQKFQTSLQRVMESSCVLLITSLGQLGKGEVGYEMFSRLLNDGVIIDTPRFTFDKTSLEKVATALSFDREAYAGLRRLETMFGQNTLHLTEVIRKSSVQ